MRCIRAKTDITNLINHGQYGQAAEPPTSEGPLVVPRIDFSFVGFVEDTTPIRLEQEPSARYFRKPSAVTPHRPFGHRHVIVPPDSTPTCPSPNIAVIR